MTHNDNGFGSGAPQQWQQLNGPQMPIQQPGFQPQPPQKPKKHTGRNIVLGALGVLGFLAIYGAVQGGEGDTAAPAPTAQAAAPRQAPSAEPTEEAPEPSAEPTEEAPEPEPEPSVVIASTDDLEDALDDAGVSCDTLWINGEDAGFDTSEYGVDLEACGQMDGDAIVVAYLGDSVIPVDVLVSTLQEQGTFAGQYAVSGDDWLVVAPTKREAKLAETGLEGHRERL